MKSITAAAVAAATVLLATAASAAQSSPEEQAFEAKMTALAQSLHPQFGDVRIPEASARLALGPDYYFLPGPEARRVLTEAWGNPPAQAEGVLGIVFPKGRTFLDDGWSAVVTYDAAGFVTEEPASQADYEEMIRQAQASEKEVNAERAKGGFLPIHLVGWAQPPSHDPANHTLIWARDVQFGDETDHTLNYDVRVLGRRGVLSLNMISTMSDLANVRAAAETLRARAAYEPGAAFADYKPGQDKAAGYGIAALVTAGVGAAGAKKLGLLAILAVFAKKGIAFGAAFGAAAVAWFKRRLGRKPPPSA